MADPRFVTISTERGPIQVSEDLAWGNSAQSAADKSAEHLASGSTTGSQAEMPKVVDSGSNGQQ